MSGHFAAKNALPVVRDNEETVQRAKRKRRHREEVHCGDSLAGVIQKCCPSFRRLGVPRRIPHPSQYASL